MQYFYTCDHELSLNGLWLHGAGVDLGDFPYRFNIAGDSLDFGSHDAILEVVRNLWADGSEVASSGADNAETSFSVMIEGEDLTALAQGEAALRRAFPEPGQYADLVWRAGDGSPASIRTVVAAQMQFVSEGVENEARELQRVFEVAVTHKPFVRSEFETVVEAEPKGVGRVETVSPINASYGWDSIPAGDLDTSGIGVSVPTGSGLVWADSIDTDGLEWLTIFGTPAELQVTISGRVYALAPQVSEDSVSTYRLPRQGVLERIEWPPRAGRRPGALSIDLRETLPAPYRPRQGYRIITVGGTERTTGVLHIESPDGVTPLGPTIIHTSPAHCPGFNPCLRPDLLPDVTPATDPAAPDGSWVRFDESSAVMKRDISMVCKGSYAFVGYIKADVTATVTLTLSTVSVPPGGTFDVEQLGGYVTKTVSLTAGVPKMVILGVAEWLSLDAGSGDAYVILSDGTTTGVTLQVGGLWAFLLGDDSSLTIVDSEDPHLWVRSGLPGRNARVRINAVESEESGYNPGPSKILAGPDLKYSAGETLTYVVTTGVDDAEVSYRFHKKWQAHAADDGSLP